MEIIEAANRQLTVKHPGWPEVNSVDVTEFYDAGRDARDHGAGIVVYGESHMDRSPCGTGTAAKMTLLHHRGRPRMGQPFFISGPLGTVFEGRLVEETRIGDQRAVVAEIRGRAHITAFQTFVLNERDPFPEGYQL